MKKVKPTFVVVETTRLELVETGTPEARGVPVVIEDFSTCDQALLGETLVSGILDDLSCSTTRVQSA
jgi:hypothetical protein